MVATLLNTSSSYLEKTYGKSIHTGEEPYIYDIIIVSLIKSPVHKVYQDIEFCVPVPSPLQLKNFQMFI